MTKLHRVKIDPDGLIGKWGHTFELCEDQWWRFQIETRFVAARVTGDEVVYGCRLLDDGPAEIIVLSREKILGMKLYDNAEAMDDFVREMMGYVPTPRRVRERMRGAARKGRRQAERIAS
jgi:hypothetical protein